MSLEQQFTMQTVDSMQRSVPNYVVPGRLHGVDEVVLIYWDSHTANYIYNLYCKLNGWGFTLTKPPSLEIKINK